MIHWSSVLALQERHKDLLREAERARLIRTAKGPRKSKDQGLSMREPETPATVSTQASSQPASEQLAEV